MTAETQLTKSQKEEIIKGVKKLSTARTSFVKKVRNFCDEIIEAAGVKEMTLLSLKDKKYKIITSYSDVGDLNHVIIEDGRGCRSLSHAKVGGGSFYLHNDFNTTIFRADYVDCLTFIEDFKEHFSKNAEEVVKFIAEKEKFFLDKEEN